MTATGDNYTDQNGVLIGFDIGGTFTDLVLLRSDGIVTGAVKLLTTTQDIAAGAIDGIHQLLHEQGVEARDVVALIHATTQTSNTLVERSGPKVALVTTEGFRDILEFGREARYELYDLTARQVPPLVPRHLRFEIRERLTADGLAITAVDEEQVKDLCAALAEHDVQAVAVCLLHSYRNGDHEEQVGYLLREGGFDGQVVLSSDTCSEIREFERASTTVANAYLSPRVSGYINRLDELLKESAISAPWYMMSSHGGRLSVQAAARRPVELLECGAAAGVLAAATIARQMGWSKALSFDMGGTTAKAAIVLDGVPMLTRSYEVARQARFKKGSGIPIQAASVDLIEIGAGGGSIAKVNRLGLVEVGPESAGSEPGPACYAKGGTQPTVSDACLQLGHLNPDGLLAGSFPLSAQAATNAIESALAGPLSVNVDDAARAVHRVVVENMANAARIHILEHGLDPREFRIIVCGGAGPMHAVEMARQLGINDVLIMPRAGVGAAVGLLEAPPVARSARSLLQPVDRLDWDTIAELIKEMRAEILTDLGADGTNGVTYRVSCDMRYRGQGHEINVEFIEPPFPKNSKRQLEEAFLTAYAAVYGRTNLGSHIEVVSWRLEGMGPRPTITLHEPKRSGAKKSTATVRKVSFGDSFMETPVLGRDLLTGPAPNFGPALIEERETTTVVPPGAEYWSDEYGNLRIKVEA